MAPTESRLPSCTNRFFLQRLSEGGSLSEDLMAHLQKIEDFIDNMEQRKYKNSETSEPMRKSLKKLRGMRQKFSLLTKKHPYDTFFDEETARFDFFTFLKEIKLTKLALMKILNSGHLQDLPADIESNDTTKKVFDFIQFTQKAEPGEAKIKTVKKAPYIKNFFIDRKSVPDQEAKKVVCKENSRLKMYTKVINMTQNNTPRQVKKYGSQFDTASPREETLSLMMNRMQNKSRDIELLGQADSEYNGNATQLTKSIRRFKESSLPELAINRVQQNTDRTSRSKKSKLEKIVKVPKLSTKKAGMSDEVWIDPV